MAVNSALFDAWPGVRYYLPYDARWKCATTLLVSVRTARLAVDRPTTGLHTCVVMYYVGYQISGPSHTECGVFLLPGLQRDCRRVSERRTPLRNPTNPRSL